MSKVLKAMMEREIESKLEGVDGGLLVSTQGLDSEKTYDFRATLHGRSLKYTVLRNALARRVLAKSGYPEAELEGVLKGSVGVVYSREGEEGSAQAAARAVADWKKEKKDKIVQLVGAFMDGTVVQKKDAETLKDAPTKDQARAMLCGVLQAPVVRLVSTLREPAARMVYVVDAIQRKLEEGKEG